MKLSNLNIFCFILFIPFATHAQKINLIKPSITVSTSYFPSSKLIDSLGIFQNQIAQLGFCIPVWNNFKQLDTTNKSNYFQIYLRNTNYISQPHLSNFIQNQNLFGTSLGISSFWVKNKSNFFAISLNSLCRSDETTVQNPSIRFSGSVLYKRIVTKGFSYHFGLVYSYIIGRDVWLPAIGINLRTGHKGRLSINFPNKIAYIQRFGKGLALTMYIKPYGTYNYIANKSYAAATSTYYLRQRENHLGACGLIKISSSLVSTLDFGFAFNRRIQFSEGLNKKSSTYFKSKIENGIYFGVGIKYVFRNQKRKSIDSELLEYEKEELISDPYFESLITD